MAIMNALEIMKAVSDRLPEGVTLSSWNYKRDEGIRVSGDAETSEATYAFKDAMDAMTAGDEEDGEKIFNTVNLNGPNASKGGYRFDLDNANLGSTNFLQYYCNCGRSSFFSWSSSCNCNWSSSRYAILVFDCFYEFVEFENCSFI